MITRVRSKRGTFTESWTDEKIRFVKENFQKMPYADLAKKIGGGVTEKSIGYVVRKRLKLRKAKKRQVHRADLWTQREDDVLREKYPTATKAEIIKALSELGSKRTWGAIGDEARKLGLRRDRKFLSFKYFPKESKKRLLQSRGGRPSHRKGLSLREEYGLKRSKKVREKLSESHKGHSPDEKTREKMSKSIAVALAKKWEDPQFQERQRKARVRKPNKFEREFSDAFPELKYVGDFSLWVGRKNPDFIMPNTIKCVDLFSKPWHTRKEVDKRIAYFANLGYSLFIVWYEDWRRSKKSRKFLIQRVKEFIGDRK